MMILRRITFIVGALMLIALAAQNAAGSTWILSLDAQFLLFVGGVIGVAWGLGNGITSTKTPDTPRTRGFIPLLTSTPFLLIIFTLIALILRLWQLETLVHYFVDELNFVDGVLDVIDARSTGEALHLIHPFHWLTAFPRLYPYLQGWGTIFAGQTLTGLRVASVLFGALTVPATYMLGKEMFDRRVGLIAALLLATFPPHIHFSRLGLNNIADPLFATLSMAFLVRALRDGRQGDFAWAGAMLGMTQYFYEGGRLLYPVVIGAWLAWSLYRRRISKHIESRDVVQTPFALNVLTKSDEPISWRNVGVFVLAAGLVVLPYYAVTFSFNLNFTPRLEGKGLDPAYWEALLYSSWDTGLQGHLVHMSKSFLIYATLPDQSFYYGGPMPLLLPYLVPAFFIGIVRVLWRGWRVLLLILLLASLGNTLLRFSAWASGFVVTFPTLCLLVAVGLQQLGRWVQNPRVRFLLPSLKSGTGWRWGNVAAILVSLLALGQILYYFGPHLTAFTQGERLMPDTQDAMFRSLEFPPNTYVHFVGDIVFFEFDIIRMQTYLGRPDLHIDVVREVGRASNFTSDYLASLPRDADHAFFLPINNADNVTLLRQYFEVEGPFYTTYPVPRDAQLVLYYASAP